MSKCPCDDWAREYAPTEPRELHHKFCSQYAPATSEPNPFVRDCPRCKTPGQQCQLCGAVLGEVITSEPFPLPYPSDETTPVWREFVALEASRPDPFDPDLHHVTVTPRQYHDSQRTRPRQEPRGEVSEERGRQV